MDAPVPRRLQLAALLGLCAVASGCLMLLVLLGTLFFPDPPARLRALWPEALVVLGIGVALLLAAGDRLERGGYAR